MRRLFVCFWVLLFCFPAFAEETAPDYAAAWFDAQTALLNPSGAEIRQERRGYLLSLPEGGQAESLCLTVEGDLKFGRYDQQVRTALIDPQTGEEIALTAIFPDPDALQEFLDAYVEENVLDSLNTYLDAADLLPVPLDAVSFDEQGVTFHYPRERFQYFSGHAGAVQLQWYELRDHCTLGEMDAPLPLEPGGNIDELLEAYGSLTEPDLVTGGEGLWAVENGVAEMGLVTGTGCMLSCVSALTLSAFGREGAGKAALLAAGIMGLAGEEAKRAVLKGLAAGTGETKGPLPLGAFHMGLLDAFSTLTPEKFREGARIQRII